jgi:hypothetical protein
MPKDDDRYQAPAEAFQILGAFAHCDPCVVHAPKTCEFCDLHPDWQALRQVWAINFTNENDPQKSPCPSLRYRKAYEVNRWHGNRPSKGDGYATVDVQPPTAWEHLEGDSDLDD